jgi:formylglycine-generating enzyme required for sulfatase activity
MEFEWVDNLPGTQQASWDSAHQHGGWVGKYLVTQKEFASVMSTNPSKNTQGGDSYPVESMTAADVDGFCRSLPAMDQNGRPMPKDWSYQLLTIDQWRFCLKDVHETDCILSTPTSLRAHPEPAGARGTNAFGLVDIMGNVYEVVTDPQTKSKKIIGAGFRSQKASRIYLAFERRDDVGLRIAIVPNTPTP